MIKWWTFSKNDLVRQWQLQHLLLIRTIAIRYLHCLQMKMSIEGPFSGPTGNKTATESLHLQRLHPDSELGALVTKTLTSQTTHMSVHSRNRKESHGDDPFLVTRRNDASQSNNLCPAFVWMRPWCIEKLCQTQSYNVNDCHPVCDLQNTRVPAALWKRSATRRYHFLNVHMLSITLFRSKFGQKMVGPNTLHHKEDKLYTTDSKSDRTFTTLVYSISR